MKERISELLDGELESSDAAGRLDALRADGEARDAWRSYHMIGDAMRDTRILSPGFASRVATRLDKEATVMAPVRRASTPQRQRWQFLSAAASVAAVALVGWVAFGLQENTAQLAATGGQGPAGAAQVLPAAAQVAPPSAANDYLYAHQGLSPRNSLQGVAPYVRMVSREAAAQKR